MVDNQPEPVVSTHATRIPNRPLNHVAVSVSNIDAVVDWYSRTFGFQKMRSGHIKRSENPDNPVFGIYPPDLQEYKIAFLATGNGGGFEVIEYIDPAPVPRSELSRYNRAGLVHIAVTDEDPAGLADRVVRAGGKRIGKAVEYAGFEIVYTTDPWGNVVEIMQASFERVNAATSA
ncbi:hypothetical protein FQN52_003062 [Onygenales sp. PD_12]|nr:hypothetical protein FQN53_008541 [Emmonsiellopsis sp. PD_33]KAK2792557.1 hypothetical protein FQN52_003062 [Onygenales sp. PD_12]KAK2806046.1 hypothetical protein FQN51_007999 [Onygenales sp. PD_10]